MNTADERAIPGRGWYAFAGALAFASTVAIAAFGAWLLFAPSERQQFLVPGRHTMQLAGAASYLIWNEYQTVFDGQSYRDAEELPQGMRLSVIDKASGERIASRSSRNVKVSDSSTKRRSVAQFRTLHAGMHEIVVEGDFPPRVFSASRDYFVGALWRTVGIFGSAFLGFAAAVAIFGWAYIRREEAANAAARTAAPTPVDAAAQAQPNETELKRLAMIVYALQIAGYFVGVTFIAGVIINYIKLKEVEGTWLESHFRWQIRTFWFGVMWSCIGFALLVVMVGFLILIGAAVWVLYRAIKGWIELSEGKPLPG
jgi:uncharacterized membrane protein